MGTALTYARRYALFALVGIAGEDDLDAPDIANEPAPSPGPAAAPASARKPRNATLHQPPPLGPIPSAALRDQMLAEIAGLSDSDGLASWIHRRMRDKNALTAVDGRAIEVACERLLGTSHNDVTAPLTSTDLLPTEGATQPQDTAPSRSTVRPQTKPLRQRSKEHLAFVAAQPCLICQRTPCDAHHLKFAQPKALGRKVSDEFTVPLCRDHHHQLHRHGNERAFWANLKLAPLEVAKDLWLTGPEQSLVSPASAPVSTDARP
jgi:hypothetical protein